MAGTRLTQVTTHYRPDPGPRAPVGPWQTPPADRSVVRPDRVLLGGSGRRRPRRSPSGCRWKSVSAAHPPRGRRRNGRLSVVGRARVRDVSPPDALGSRSLSRTLRWFGNRRRARPPLLNTSPRNAEVNPLHGTPARAAVVVAATGWRLSLMSSRALLAALQNLEDHSVARLQFGRPVVLLRLRVADRDR